MEHSRRSALNVRGLSDSKIFRGDRAQIDSETTHRRVGSLRKFCCGCAVGDLAPDELEGERTTLGVSRRAYFCHARAASESTHRTAQIGDRMVRRLICVRQIAAYFVDLVESR